MITRYTLLERVRDRSDERSWEDFIDIYRPYIYKVLRRMNFLHEEAEDLSQNVLVVLWDKMPEFKHNFRTGAFRSWLCTIVRNKGVDYIRKHTNRKNKLDNQSDLLLSPLMSENTNDLQKAVEEEWNKHISDLAWKTIEEEFSENVRKAFLLSVEGISGEEIAERLDVQVNSIYTYKKRIRNRLKEVIRGLNDQYV
ncbi:MAG: RNA polymerase sigma factor [Lentisphaeraceae bacterium]|nr:RNA polymerase sigma factor [Lentisphaeraceae bacterium]